MWHLSDEIIVTPILSIQRVYLSIQEKAIIFDCDGVTFKLIVADIRLDCISGIHFAYPKGKDSERYDKLLDNMDKLKVIIYQSILNFDLLKAIFALDTEFNNEL